MAANESEGQLSDAYFALGELYVQHRQLKSLHNKVLAHAVEMQDHVNELETRLADVEENLSAVFGPKDREKKGGGMMPDKPDKDNPTFGEYEEGQDTDESESPHLKPDDEPEADDGNGS